MNQFKEDKFDYLQYLYTFLKDKKIFFYALGVSLFLGLIYAFTKENEFIGNFQIVISRKNDNVSRNIQTDQLNPVIAKFLRRQGREDIRTELEILRSPSILNPVFLFVKEMDSKNGIKTEKYKYQRFFNKLSIELVSGTQVLRVSYKDKDENKIIPVLNKLSETYKIYSSKDYKKTLNTGLEFIQSQIDKYSEENLKALKDAQTFAMDNNLNIVFALQPSTQIITPFEIEKKRIAALDKINFLDRSIDRLKLLDSDSKEIKYFLKTFPEFNSDLIRKLDALDKKLINSKRLYKEDDFVISDLKRERRNLNNLLKDESLGFLLANRSITHTNMKALERPSDVLVEFREMTKKIINIEKTLKSLESDKITFAIEQAKGSEPWELITDPTILDEKTGNSKKEIMFFSLFFGFFISIVIIGLRTEFYKKIPYTLHQFQKKIKYPLITRIKINDSSNYINEIKFVKNKYLEANSEKELALVPLVSNNKIDLKKLKKIFEINKNSNLLITNDLLKAKEYKKQILVLQSGLISSSELDKFINMIQLQEGNTIGWIFLDFNDSINFSEYLKNIKKFNLGKFIWP